MQGKNSPTLVRIFTILVIITLFSGCKATIYTAPEFTSVKEKHKVLAILPFDVSVSRKKLPKGLTIELLKEMEKDEAYVIQSEIYTYFLKGMSKNKYTIDFQDIDTTNSLLLKAGITFENMRNYSKSELAEILNVDAILSGRVHRSRPMSTGAAIALAIVFAPFGATNKVDVDVAIHSTADGKLIWNYNHTYKGGIGSSSHKLTKRLMKDISKKFPYSKK